jgi:DNA-binding transcriptional ArsR family regulator
MAKSHAHAEQLRQLVRVLSLLGLPIRVVMLQRLARTPSTAGELARTLPISRPAVVQHLKLLEAARLVGAYSDGRRRIYRIRPEGLDPLVRWLTSVRTTYPDERFSRAVTPRNGTESSVRRLMRSA